MEDAIAAMKRAGAVDRRPGRTSRRAGEFDDAELEVLLYEFKAGPATPTSPRSARPRRCRRSPTSSRFNEAHRDREMPYFGQELFAQGAGEGPADRHGLPDGAGEVPARCRATRASTRLHRRSTGSTRSSRRPAVRRGRPTWSTATTSPAAARRRPRWPAIPTSPCRPASSTACRWACRSSAARGASRR